LDQVLNALTALGIMTGVARSATVYATVSASHVLGIALLLGPILLVNLRLVGLLGTLDHKAFGILRRTAMVGVALSMLTGLLLFSAKPADYAANAVVWTKLAVIAAAILHALAFERAARRHGTAVLMAGPRVWISGLTSAGLWLGALFLGRWIAFA
jgi:hypothetical protein